MHWQLHSKQCSDGNCPGQECLTWWSRLDVLRKLLEKTMHMQLLEIEPNVIEMHY